MVAHNVSVRVATLTRFPVKSLVGERISECDVDERGLVGDRVWSVRTADDKIGSGKNTRRFAAIPGLLDLRAETVNGEVIVTFPNGTTCTVDDPDADDRLSTLLGQDLRFARETEVGHFDDGPISLIGTASIAALQVERQEPVAAERFRANLLLQTDEPFVEQGLIGRQVRVGTALLDVTMASVRCVMVDMRTADLPPQPGNLKTVGRVNQTLLGVIARVVEPGTVRVGDPAVAVQPSLQDDSEHGAGEHKAPGR